MKALTKKIAGAAAAALITVSAATPAYADHRSDHDRDGIDVGDIITGVAVVAGVAAAVSAATGQGRYDPYNRGYDNRGYGYPSRGYGYPGQGHGYGYGGEQLAVDACASYAQRYGGQVQITDVRRDGRRSFDVRGVIQTGYNNTYSRSYNRRYDPRYDRGYNRGYNHGGQIAFECDVRDNGRVTDFDTRRNRY